MAVKCPHCGLDPSQAVLPTSVRRRIVELRIQGLSYGAIADVLALAGGRVSMTTIARVSRSFNRACLALGLDPSDPHIALRLREMGVLDLGEPQ